MYLRVELLTKLASNHGIAENKAILHTEQAALGVPDLELCMIVNYFSSKPKTTALWS
ncbi:MAG: hypothetical protein ACI81P_001786 [Neolewinella sp.]|jgi:hypothetical protein